MTEHINFGIIIAAVMLIQLLFIVIIVKSRFKTFRTDQFVLRFRNGALQSSGYGGGYFLLPLIDEIVTLPTSVETVDFVFEVKNEKMECPLELEGFILFRIKDPVKAIRSLKVFGHNGPMDEISDNIYRATEAYLKNATPELGVEKILRNKLILEEGLKGEITEFIIPMGLEITKIGITDVTKIKITE